MRDHLASPFKKLRMILIHNPPPPTAICVTRDTGIVGSRKLKRQFTPVQKHPISRQGPLRRVGNPPRKTRGINRAGNQIRTHRVAITDPVRGCGSGQDQHEHSEDHNKKPVQDKMFQWLSP